MATFLDLGLLGHFAIIFPFLLVFLGSYAVLLKLKVISEDKGINAIISLSLASMTLFSGSAVQLIFVATPWLVVAFMAIMALLVILMFMGVKEETIGNVMKSDWHTPHWIILIIVLLIFVGAASAVFGPSLAEEKVFTSSQRVSGAGDSGDINATGGSNVFQQTVTTILFHPKVIGVIALLLIASFTIRTLASGPPESSGGGKK